MAGVIEKTMLLGLGLLTLTREKVTQFVDELVKEGEVKPEESRNLANVLISKGEEEREELRKLVREEVKKIRGARPVSRQEFAELSKRVDELAARIEKKAARQ